MRSTPRPSGFFVLGASAFGFGALMAMVLADPMVAAPGLLPTRAAMACAGVLALVAGEALIFARPWAYRASVALALAYAAMVAVAAVQIGSWLMAVGFNVLSAGITVPAVQYVRDSAARAAGGRRRVPLPPIAP